ncbi:MAG TPA: hypothetical protein HPP51_00830 [Planctomycetes bacterium]|nr:hypothetical protein [Planctomycetota bacterium]
MATDLTTIFGSSINVTVQPREVDRRNAAYPGADGLTSMCMGTRGRAITVGGLLSASGANYNTARSSLQTIIDGIEAYLDNSAAQYTFKGQTFSNTVFEQFRIVPAGDGKSISWTASGYCVCRFVATLRELI